jgi:aldose 1-epimerase
MTRFITILLAAFFVSCSVKPNQDFDLKYTSSDFQGEINGKKTTLFMLKNKHDMIVTLTNYGAKIVSIVVPDKKGEMADILLGFKSLADYQKFGGSHGATIGPFANRIAGASFRIGDSIYKLPANNAGYCIHSGPQSFYRQVWDANQIGNSVEMKLLSADGEWGFPGNKQVKVIFTLNDQNELRIVYRAVTDKPTHFNLTNHSYFNLRGEGNGDVLGHIVTIQSDRITAVDSLMIPTGEYTDIKGTDLDFSEQHAIGDRIDNDNPQLRLAHGYDFNYVINKEAGKLALATTALEPESGRFMEVFTTEPGVQLYTGNNLKGTETGKSGIPYTARTGLCFETQHFPDSPNKPQFPTTLLLPGDTLKSTTIYKFSVKK